jgi:predicted RND superfamily exporter protein
MSKFGESILRACAHLAANRPWLVLGVALVATLLGGYASTRLTVDTSTEDILSIELPFGRSRLTMTAPFRRKTSPSQ